MPPIKVVALEEGIYNGKVVPEGATFILVDRLLPAIEKGPHKRKGSTLKAEDQFSENWMERILREHMLDIGHEQFLVLLLVVNP